MFEPLYVAATGLNAYQDEISDITNNLANAKTTAFKKGRVEMESLFFVQKSFDQVLADSVGREDAFVAPVGVEYGTGVRVAATPKDFTQGSLEVTNNPLDIAIQGDGFMQFRMPDGTLAYGRAGNLHVDNEGNVVDANGHLMEAPLTIPENTTGLLVQPDGKIFAETPGQLERDEIGQIELAKFTNPAGLRSLGQNLYAATPASGEPVTGYPADEGFGTVAQYSLEQSNVDVISEMMRMIAVQRVFDTITKAVTSYEGMLTSLQQMRQ
ncbi:MAG: flagellar basal-body rod protein FlgG [bacterium]